MYVQSLRFKIIHAAYLSQFNNIWTQQFKRILRNIAISPAWFVLLMQFVPLTNGCEELIPEHQRNVYRKDIQLISTELHRTLDWSIVTFYLPEMPLYTFILINMLTNTPYVTVNTIV